jgi:antitoxin component HigA of HigAB toxin-antitoxin module
MEFQRIINKEQYHQYLDKINDLMDTDPSNSSEEGKLLAAMATLVEDYEMKQRWIFSAEKLNDVKTKNYGR